MPANRRQGDDWKPAYVWWLDPRLIVGAGLLPLYLILWGMSTTLQSRTTAAGSVLFFDGEYAVLGLGSLLALWLGTLIPLNPRPVRRELALRLPPRAYLKALAILSLVGYVFWFREYIFNPMRFIELLRSDESLALQVRDSLERPAGIASFATLGLPFLVYSAVVRWGGDETPLSRSDLALCALVFGFTLFRVFVWGERLALIEVCVAFALVWFGLRPMDHPLMRVLRWAFPLIALVLVVSLFALAEYFRSWVFYSKFEDSFASFIAQRLLNYYFEALNTGAGILATSTWPQWHFESIMTWLHRMPVVGPIFTAYAGRSDSLLYLVRYGRVEFNNISGAFVILQDIGVLSSYAFLVLFGAVSRYFHACWQQGRRALGIIYVLLLQTLIEFLRVFYLGDSRTFLVLLAFLMGLLLLQQPRISVPLPMPRPR